MKTAGNILITAGITVVMVSGSALDSQGAWYLFSAVSVMAGIVLTYLGYSLEEKCREGKLQQPYLQWFLRQVSCHMRTQRRYRQRQGRKHRKVQQWKQKGARMQQGHTGSRYRLKQPHIVDARIVVVTITASPEAEGRQKLA